MSNILVTGASGAMGAWLASRLVDEGHHVISIAHDEKPCTTAKLLEVHDNITWVHGNIQDGGLCARIMIDYNIDTVYHLAALPLVQVAGPIPRQIFETNILGTVSLLDATRLAVQSGRDIKFIAVATDKVYGNAGTEPYTEDQPLNASAIYDASKASMDIICRAYAASGFVPQLAVVRPCNVIIPLDLNLGRVIPRTILPAIRGESPVLFNNKNYVREFIDIIDLENGLIHIAGLLDYTKHCGEAFNLGSGNTVNIKQCVNEILNNFADIQATWIDNDNESFEIPYQRLDTSKLDATGWHATYSFEDSISECVDHWHNVFHQLPPYIKQYTAKGWHG